MQPIHWLQLQQLASIWPVFHFLHTRATESEPRIVEPAMKLKDAFNSRTLLIPSLALNVVLLSFGARAMTRIQNLYTQVIESAAAKATLGDSFLLFSDPARSPRWQRGDETGAALVSKIGIDPLQHHRHLVSETDEEDQVYEQPGQPRH